MIATGGGRANMRGRMLERNIAELLGEEYRKVKPSEFFALCEAGQPIFAQQCPVGTDLYGKRRRVDFILYHPMRWPDCLVIQCKWQASSGSVEEKYPFEVLSIECNDHKTIIVQDGGGYSQGAEDWLKAQAGKGGRLLHVLTLGGISNFQSQGKL